jgi:hypothetical protein
MSRAQCFAQTLQKLAQSTELVRFFYSGQEKCILLTAGNTKFLGQHSKRYLPPFNAAQIPETANTGTNDLFRKEFAHTNYIFLYNVFFQC